MKKWKSNIKEDFLIFGETKTPKDFLYLRKRNFLTFQETELSDPENKNFQEAIFRAPKVKKKTVLKKILIFEEIQLFNPKFLYFWKEFAKPEYQNFLIFL